MKIHRYVLPVLVVGALLGSVAVAQLTGQWVTSGKAMVQRDAAGAADPQGIKGWMTLQQVSDTYGIPLAELYVRIGATTAIAPETALKDLEKQISGFEVSLVRDVVTAYRAEGGGQAPSTPQVAPAAAPAAGRLPAAEIKGSMALADVAAQCQIPIAELLQRLNMPAGEAPNTAVKDLKAKYGLEVEAVRTAVAEYQAAHP